MAHRAESPLISLKYFWLLVIKSSPRNLCKQKLQSKAERHNTRRHNLTIFSGGWTRKYDWRWFELRNRKQTRQTHNTGAKLLVCDVQGVSVFVKPPACPVFTRPLPVFNVRHLSGLKQRQRYENLKRFWRSFTLVHTQYTHECFVLTRVLCVA